ncbi:hypothetical protein, partial [Streptomyces sp. NPDC056512]|uniref:hypothetical protein n=1 Tax=Streptomyces sp. NPDC056512 TaxID=3345846 RepID=UPI0036CC7BD8
MPEDRTWGQSAYPWRGGVVADHAQILIKEEQPLRCLGEQRLQHGGGQPFRLRPGHCCPYLGPAASSGTGPVDVVKVAHHGSATQSDRLAQVLAPTVALVSSGENTYGHPTDRALDLYRGVGATVLRTDACGTVALVVRD